MRPLIVHWLEHFVRPGLASFLAPSWFMCVGLAGLAALVLMIVLGRRRGMDAATIASAVLSCYVAAVLAGILVPALIDGVQRLFATGHFSLRWSGMTSFWGYLAGTAAVAVVCQRDGVSLARMGDLAVIPLGVALVLARIGCFMAGCDYGKVSSVPWAVRFPAGSPAWRDHVHAGLIGSSRAASLPVHPTQLYEALLGLVIVGVALLAARWQRRDGRLFLLAAATYAIGRLGIETMRGDAGRGIYGGLASGQIFSLLVLAAIAVGLVLTKRRAAMMAAAAAALLLMQAGGANAQPGATEPQPPLAASEPTPEPAESQGPSVQVQVHVEIGSQQPDQEPPPRPQSPLELSPQDLPPPPMPDPAERPQFFTGLLFGMATPLNRRAGQVRTLAGPSISLGYLPGRFGVWLDLDSYANTDATHGTLLVSGSFTQRLTPRLVIGARLGIGETEVNFRAPAFRDVGGPTFRLEMIAEIVLARHWSIWVRPLTIDAITAADLGGPITTYQARLGLTYRFGSRQNAVRPIPPPPSAPPPFTPPPPPLDPTAPQPVAAATTGTP